MKNVKNLYLVFRHVLSRAHEHNVYYDTHFSLQNKFRFSVVAGVSALNEENGFCNLLVSVHCC